jgi:hypothetical protein
MSREVITNVLLVILVLAIMYLAFVITNMHADLSPLLNSRLAGAVAGL